MNWSVLPNAITILRVILLFPLSVLLIEGDYATALVIFVIAGVSDGLDGYLAKHFNWVSRFGAILDPLADKALLVVTMAILTFNGEISLILFWVVACRDIFIVSGAYFYHYRLGPFNMAPSYLSKFNTFVQILLVFGVLSSLGYFNFNPKVINWLEIATYATTIISGIHYGVVWGKKYRAAMAEKQLNSEHESQSDSEK